MLVLSVLIVGHFYFKSINQTIFDESSVHLSEIYHQTNQSFGTLVDNTWRSLHSWEPYLRETTDDAKKSQYVNALQQESEFTEFYFINENGNYLTVAGKSGYLDMKDKLDSLVVDGEDIVVFSVVPGKPEIVLFAVPAQGSYSVTEQGREVVQFNYQAIAVSYDNDDIVSALQHKAYEGASGSFVVHGDGKVLLEKPVEGFPETYNFLATLRKHSNLSANELENLHNNLLQGKSGVTTISVEGTKYYLVYQPMAYEDWMLLGVVPTSAVNAGMNSIQMLSSLIIASLALVFIAAFAVYFIWRYRRNLTKKDNELRNRDELFSVLSNNVDDVFLMLNAKNLNVDYISPNVEKLTGISLQEARSDIYVLNNLIQEYSVRILDELPNLQPGQQGEWDRIYVHQQTGEKRWFHVVAMTSEVGDSKKYIMVMSDRTNDKTINQALEDAVAAAQSANRAKSSFLSNMSHDIRTPMNAIIGFATLAAANATDAEKVKDYLSKILSSGNHLLSLINDILDMSRIESGKIQLEESAVNLSDLLHDIRTIIGGQIHAKQLDLFMDVIDVVDEYVYCDKTRINQVLLNLLSNAIKFTQPGGAVSVRVSQLPNAPEGKGLYEIRVKDTGIGMSPEFLKKIFDPFERERTSTVSRIQGTGLGMAISKNIVDMMGGTIEVFTEMGKGTEFVIKLALRLPSEHRNVEKIKELENLRALVVDDDFNTCDSVTKMLAQVGMRSEWTLSGKEAVLRAKQSLEMNDAFHAYIIDWRLPDMNGLEVTRQIRSLGDNTPIIILTAYDWSDIEKEAREAGVTAFCAKPMFMSDLRDSLLSALGQQELQKEPGIAAFEENVVFSDKRLLLVEDNELNREIAMEILSAHGFSIEVAQNGAEAVEKVGASQPHYYDLVLMDIQMPIMNGYEATKRIRALENVELSQVPIFAMTANAFDEDRKAALECGMDGFFTKPLELKDVLDTLTEFFKAK